MNEDPAKPDQKKPTDLRIRTRDYALRIIRLYSALPKAMPAQVIGKQLLRCGTSVGAQYREAHRAKSDADFVSKLEGVLQELDESDFWLELLVESGILTPEKMDSLRNETSELIAIFVASVKHVKAKM